MKKIIISIISLLVLLGVGFGLAFFLKSDQDNRGVVTNKTINEQGEKNRAASLISLEKTIDVTPDDKYSYGGFCRVNYLPDQDNFFVTFGGANPNLQSLNSNPKTRAGGAEGGNGYSYKIYSKDFEYTGENGTIHIGGGDAASIMANDFYYFLTGGGKQGWVLKKIDPSDWQTIKTVEIEMDLDHEILSDQMLAYADGKLFASSQYDPLEKAERKVDPFVGSPSHLRIFDEELNQLDYFLLDDATSTTGSFLVLLDGVYNFITSTAYFGDLVVLQYDENWNYLGLKKLDDWAMWPQGAIYDSENQRFYVAYLDYDMNEVKSRASNINVALGIFDKQWNQLEKIMVTDFSGAKNAGRPWVILQDDKLYISYDVATEEQYDWQCETKIYSIL